ncbi:DnaJ family domain-containing protein [Piscinibacter sp. XHJ-5]|uniref:DnaJ family domain-containing protein n=1 Tax=Piscinibacter sp. XHJ-5 TaxID=3037797 RepID=UPI002452E6EB|nr:DnaJ family domain-containing protein [Piscinibacter sp. XHJ-5]
MPTLDEEIARHLQESLASGELRSARDWGRPLDLGDGYDDTPPELRMPFKVLKDAGMVPHEVEMMRRAAALRRAAETADPGTAEGLRRELADLQQQIALRLEHLRISGTL